MSKHGCFRWPFWAVFALSVGWFPQQSADADDSAPPPHVVHTIVGTGHSELTRFSGLAHEFNLDQPFGVEWGPDGALYICEVGHHRVLSWDPTTGHVTTVAGTGWAPPAGKVPTRDALGSATPLAEPYEVRFDSLGNLYVVEMIGAVVRRLDARTGTMSVVAGTGHAGFSGDGGPAVSAKLNRPHSIALYQDTVLFIADIGNHRIRRVDLATGQIGTVAGTGQAALPRSGQPALGQPLAGPRALFVQDDVLWVALREGNSIWRIDLRTGLLEHVAGTGEKGNRDGAAEEAMFNGPKGIVADGQGNVYVMDTENQAIRRIDLARGGVSTIAGAPERRGYGGDGKSALRASFDRPHGIAYHAATGSILVGDSNNHRVRVIVPLSEAQVLR